MNEIGRLMDDATRRINAIYKTAEKSIYKQLQSALESVSEQEKFIQKQLENGEITETNAKEKMKALFLSISGISRLADIVFSANKESKDVIKKLVAKAFTNGLNSEMFGIEHDMNEDIGFVPVNEDDIIEWMDEDPDLFPVGEVNEKKDKEWNLRNITGALITAALLGHNRKKAADYVTGTVVNRNRTAMQQNKYDTLSGANNAGHQQGMEEAQNKGVEMLKEWSATLDFKTRDAHRQLDGQRVPVDKPFEIDGEEIMFPRDPAAKAYLRCNCRCAYRRINPKWPSNSLRKENIKDENGDKPLIKNMTYDEWFKMKQDQYGAEEIDRQIKEMKRQQRQKYYRKKKRERA